MATSKAKAAATISEPSTGALRSMFRASARAFLQNRPLRGWSAPTSQPSSALSTGELRALQAVGLSTEPWPTKRPDDPLSQSIVDYMALVETSVTAAQAARLLGVDVSRVRQRLRQRSLFGLEFEGEWRLPRFQFERGRPLPGLASILEAIPADLNALDVAQWFLSPNPDLEIDTEDTPLSPRRWLLRGLPPERVAELTRDL